ncbi:DNA-protecting protein DprA [Erwinia tracheiphila]|uniref:DNA-protecting protein DprA n=1 Tax=Erwinia tracheiphila TaxID=65700 RepID=A0A345CXD7_9GAMM|nr:DNA-protecting protein DprA [Erwinia tracheiphila]AXF78104.1 DNA-protecting protein DprA [Erwinia tracheiphila]UIA83182.1 DNA-protecting protein DprA [Erwinia tracheiphila]UIA91761.1 DNA-protecting protein DprA [Erwinia tracheiphila]
MTMAEIWLRLSAVRGLEKKQYLQVVELCERESLNAEDALKFAGLNLQQRKAFLQTGDALIQSTLSWLECPQNCLLNFSSRCYPELLRTVIDHPPLIFVQGDPELLLSPQIAIVGSRNCSHYGRNWGRFFAQALALNGITITSGLAAGIDGVAHRSALDVGGKTIAVLGSGLNNIYPKQHRSLAKDIIANGGAIISEFPLSTPPISRNFPYRNRIISGLSLGVLVVEAVLKSGSLVTAMLALEQNRDVYSVPGAIGNPGSEGTHWLIQQGALLTSHPNTILKQLQSDLKWLPVLQKTSIYSASEDNTALPFPDVLANVGDEVTPVDVVAERAGQPVPAIVAKLLELELAGWIAAVPGGYVRLRRASHVRRTNVFV